MSSILNLTVCSQLLDALLIYGLTLDEAFLLLSIRLKAHDLIDKFVSYETTESKKRVKFQSLVRKQYLDTNYTGEVFNLAEYSLTQQGEEAADILVQVIIQQSPKPGEGIMVERVKALLAPPPTQSSNEEFLQKYLEFFPKGIKNNGGKTLRTNIDDVRSKMQKFMLKYKKYADTELILKATQKFIAGYRGNYSFCPTAEYFILKDGTSALATECDKLLSSGGTTEVIVNPFDKTM